MSKYIRTNEGIYELKENMTIETGIFSFFGKIYNTSEKHLFRNDKDLGEFVSQADTIEELCDRFVTVVNDKGKVYHFTDYTFEKAKNDGDYEVYGCILTDKGLIYVAKMNDKGELELI